MEQFWTDVWHGFGNMDNFRNSSSYFRRRSGQGRYQSEIKDEVLKWIKSGDEEEIDSIDEIADQLLPILAKYLPPNEVPLSLRLKL